MTGKYITGQFTSDRDLSTTNRFSNFIILIEIKCIHNFINIYCASLNSYCRYINIINRRHDIFDYGCMYTGIFAKQ